MPITDDTRMRRGWVGSQAANFSGELLPSFGAPVTAANEMKVRTVLAIPRMATTRRSLVLIPDKADAASSAGSYLAGAWGARRFASIDPEEFYDFTAARPRVRVDDQLVRHIDWPANEFSAGAIPGAGRDAVFLRGVEPGLKWRT